jgi:hypothetical protein
MFLNHNIINKIKKLEKDFEGIRILLSDWHLHIKDFDVSFILAGLTKYIPFSNN